MGDRTQGPEVDRAIRPSRLDADPKWQRLVIFETLTKGVRAAKKEDGTAKAIFLDGRGDPEPIRVDGIGHVVD